MNRLQKSRAGGGDGRCTQKHTHKTHTNL